MAKGYWIAHVTVKDAENYPRYLAAAKEAFDKYGARFLVRGGRYDVLEGEERQRHVVIEFATFDQAVACYKSREYQAAARIRQETADADLIIVEGTDWS